MGVAFEVGAVTVPSVAVATAPTSPAAPSVEVSLAMSDAGWLRREKYSVGFLKAAPIPASQRNIFSTVSLIGLNYAVTSLTRMFRNRNPFAIEIHHFYLLIGAHCAESTSFSHCPIALAWAQFAVTMTWQRRCNGLFVCGAAWLR
jgi:hypothetical protein